MTGRNPFKAGRRAKNLNAPEHCVEWLRGCQKDPHCPIEARGPLAMLTGTDVKVLQAIAAVLVCSYHEIGTLDAVRALLPMMQEKCWPFARELFAQQGNWEDRDRYWPLVVPTQQDDLIELTIKERTAADMARTLERFAHDFKMQAVVADRVAELESEREP